MGIEMPAEVRWLIPIVVGDDWPEGDETALQRLAEVWKTAATDIDNAMREAEDAVKEATSHMDGEAAEAFRKYWEQFVKGEEATLPKMKDVSEKLSTACRNCAMQVEYAKLSIIIALVILAIQIAMMIASAVGTFGASTAGIVPAQMATRAGVQIIFRQLVQRLMQQVGRNLLGKLAMQVGIEVATSVATDLAVQGIQLVEGTRDSVDTKLTLDAAKSGLISGVVGFGVGEGMGKAFGEGVGHSLGRSIGRNAAEEAITGMGSALVEGAMSEEGIKLDDVLKAGTSGAVSGTVSGAKSHVEGLNSHIDVPTAGDMPTSRPDAPHAPPTPSAPPPSPPSTTDTPPPPRAADTVNTSFAAPPVEQPTHRPAAPDTAPASSTAQPQGFQQAPAQFAPAAAPQSAPPAPRSMPAAPMNAPSSGFSPSSSPSSAGGTGPSGGSHSPTAGGPPPSSAGPAHSGPASSGPVPSGTGGPVHGGPTTSGAPLGGGAPVAPGGHTPGGPTPGGTPSGGPAPGSHVPNAPSHSTATSASPTPSGPVPGGPTPGGLHPGGPVPGGPTPGGPTPGGPPLGGPSPGGSTPGGLHPGGSTPGGPVPGGSTPGGPVPGGLHPGGPVPGGPTPAGPHNGGPVAGGPTSTGPGRPPAGPLPGGPAPLHSTPSGPGLGGPPSPNQAPSNPPQRTTSPDGVHQAAISTPPVPPPNHPPADSPSPRQQSSPQQPAPTHVPPPGNTSAPQHQAPPRHQAPPPRGPQPAHHQQGPPPQRSSQHVPPVGPNPQRAPHPAGPPSHAAPPHSAPPHQAGPPHQAAPHQTAPHQSGPPHPAGPPTGHAPRPPADATTPHERSARTPWEESKRLRTPVPLPDGLKHLQNDVKHTKAGLSLHDSNYRAYPHSAAMVAPDPHRYTVDLHGSSDSVRVGNTELTPKDLADIIRGSGDWDGKQPIRLISCQTGTKSDGFAAQLSRELGVDVVSPTKDAWVDDMGNVFASSTHFDAKRGDFSPGWPPNGDWVTFRPDGTSTKHDRPTPPGSSPTWGDVAPEDRPRAWRRGEDGTWVTDANDNWHFVPARNAPPPHPIRGGEQPQWTPNQAPPNHHQPNPGQQFNRQGPPPGFLQPERGPQRPVQGPPPGRLPQGGQPNPMRHDPRHQQQQRMPQPEPRRFPQQQPGAFGPRGFGQGGFDPNQQQHRQAPAPNQTHPPRQAPGFVPNHDQRRPVPPPGPDGRPLPPRPMQPPPQSFGPDPRHAAPEQRPQHQPEPVVAPQQHPERVDAPQQHHQPPVAEQPKEIQRTPDGVEWVPLEEQLTMTRDRPITATELALRERALELYAKDKGFYFGYDRMKLKSEVVDYKVGLDGKFIEIPREIPTLERPDRLTPGYLKELAEHVSKYGQPEAPAHTFTPKSDDLPPGRTAQIPPGAYANTVVPVHPAQLHFNTSGNGDRLIHRNEPDFLNPRKAMFRRMSYEIRGVENGSGIAPKGTRGNAEAHIGGDTDSIYVSFTDSLDHAISRSPSALPPGEVEAGHVMIDYIVEAYHPNGIDVDASFHDAGVASPHRENEYLFAGGMPNENIYRIWKLQVTLDGSGNPTSTKVVGALVNRRFKYLSQMGDR